MPRASRSPRKPARALPRSVQLALDDARQGKEALLDRVGQVAGDADRALPVLEDLRLPGDFRGQIAERVQIGLGVVLQRAKLLLISADLLGELLLARAEPIETSDDGCPFA